MSIGSIVEMYCSTAKHNTFAKIGSAARVVKRLVMTCPVTTYKRDTPDDQWETKTATKTLACDCDAVVNDGAWYLTAQLAHEAELLLVLPDESEEFDIDFDSWHAAGNTTTLDDVFGAIKGYDDDHGPPGWDGLVEWFDGQIGTFLPFLQVLDVELFDRNNHGYGQKQVQAYSNNNHSLSVWLDWVHHCMTDAAKASTMGNWYDAGTGSYIVTVVLSFQSVTQRVHLKLAI